VGLSETLRVLIILLVRPVQDQIITRPDLFVDQDRTTLSASLLSYADCVLPLDLLLGGLGQMDLDLDFGLLLAERHLILGRRPRSATAF
jgi:hypothetical protein